MEHQEHHAGLDRRFHPEHHNWHRLLRAAWIRCIQIRPRLTARDGETKIALTCFALIKILSAGLKLRGDRAAITFRAFGDLSRRPDARLVFGYMEARM